MSARLIYGFDPLCGWCYGFGPALRAVREALPDLEIDLRMGGLVTGGRIGPYIQAADYIGQASARMRAMTGVAIGEAFTSKILGNPMVISSSVPPCDALLQVRRFAPHRVLDMAAALQTAHFRDGMDLNDPRTYATVAQGIGLDLEFRIPAPDEVGPDLEQEFTASRALGLTSYPSLLFDLGGSHKGVEASYDPDLLVRRISHELEVR